VGNLGPGEVLIVALILGLLVFGGAIYDVAFPDRE
jgi:hypothetical protein